MQRLAVRVIVIAFAVVACFLSTARAANLKPGDYTRSLQFGGISRFYEVHVPDRSPPRSGFPIVMVFHGGGSFPDAVIWESGMNGVAEDNKFVAVYPAGTVEGAAGTTNLTWNDGRPYKNGKPNNVDDVGFSLAVLNDLATVVSMDKSRVYAAGYSNGAQFVYRLVKQQPGRIAAIAAIAGQRGPNDVIQAAGPVSVIQFSGMLDTIAPYNGGSPSIPTDVVTVLQPAPQVAQQWATYDGCGAKAATRNVGQATSLDYTGGKNGTEVIFWTLKNGGHTWPGGNVEPSLAATLGAANQDIFAAELIWEFFQRHPLGK